MKNLFKLSLVIGVFVSFSACNKTYTCHCYTSGTEYVMSSKSKAGATTECEKNESNAFNGNCELKR